MTIRYDIVTVATNNQSRLRPNCHMSLREPRSARCSPACRGGVAEPDHDLAMQAIRMLRACTRVPWLGVLALESRTRSAGGDHTAWVASNALATCGRWVRRDHDLPAALDGSAAVCIDDRDPLSVLAALAVIPGVPVGPSLSLANRAMLRLLGIPVVEARSQTGGARAIVGDPAFAEGPAVRIAVAADPTGYRVGLGDARMLPAA
jgi:hypothetical protein